MNGPVEQSDSCSPKSSHEHGPACEHDHHGEHSHEHGHSHSHEHEHEHGQAASPDDGAATGQRTAAPHVPETIFSRIVGFMDIAGVFASSLCTIHCLLLPLVMLLLPVFAKDLMHHDYMHVGLAGFVFTFCLMAYIPGYMTHHDKRLIWIGVIGISLVFYATFVARQWGEGLEAAIITAGNTFIIFGHLLNRRLLAHLKCRHH